MSLESNSTAAMDFTLKVERYYTALIEAAPHRVTAEPGPYLGGKLLYAGELDDDGRALTIAGNIGGAATLAASADSDAGKRAVREGIADFLVTSLDEALRVLKNEIRKCETVAVCVWAAPEAMEREMLERGVLPDLLRPAFEGAGDAPFVAQGARRIEIAAPATEQALLTWRVESAPAQWLPRLDRIALACLDRDDVSAETPAHRWARLAPRFLGRLAQGVRILRCDPDMARDIVVRVQAAFRTGEIAVNASLSLTENGETFVVQLSPEEASDQAN